MSENQDNTGGTVEHVDFEPGWLRGEGCSDPYGIMGDEQAVGIVAMHAKCTPPCPRRLSAQAYLDAGEPEQEKAAGVGG